MTRSMTWLLFLSAGAAAVALWLAAFRRWRSGRQRAEADRGGIRALGAMLRPEQDEALSELRSRTVRAGLYGRDAIDLFLTIRFVVLVAGVGLGALAYFGVESPLLRVSGLAMGVVVGILGPSLWLERRARQRQQAVAAALPAALELLVICVEAGTGLQAAVERVAAAGEDNDVLASELRLVVADLKLGVPLEQAFRRFATRIGSQEASTLAAVIAQAATFGGRLGDLLRSRASSMREHRILALEENTGKANAKLTLPLTLCLLPAGLLLMLAGPIMMLGKIF